MILLNGGVDLRTHVVCISISYNHCLRIAGFEHDLMLLCATRSICHFIGSYLQNVSNVVVFSFAELKIHVYCYCYFVLVLPGFRTSSFKTKEETIGLICYSEGLGFPNQRIQVIPGNSCWEQHSKEHFN